MINTNQNNCDQLLSIINFFFIFCNQLNKKLNYKKFELFYSNEILYNMNQFEMKNK